MSLNSIYGQSSYSNSHGVNEQIIRIEMHRGDDEEICVA